VSAVGDRDESSRKSPGLRAGVMAQTAWGRIRFDTCRRRQESSSWQRAGSRGWACFGARGLGAAGAAHALIGDRFSGRAAWR